MFKHQRNAFLSSASYYRWNCWPTFFINKKRWQRILSI